jgi:dihydrofolate reductase
MTRTTGHMSVSLDGFVAGADQGLDNPLGIGGQKLHKWLFPASEPRHEGDVPAYEDLSARRGAYVMGRNMFGPVRGEWDQDWRGWWGDEPPYHAPVFVLTHYPHDPIEMAGGTTFHFVTDGFAAALDRAKGVAGDRDVLIAGGASTARHAFAAGALDEIVLDVAPVLLGSGERLFDGVADPGLTPGRGARLPVCHAHPLPGRVAAAVSGGGCGVGWRLRCRVAAAAGGSAGKCVPKRS